VLRNLALDIAHMNYVRLPSVFRMPLAEGEEGLGAGYA